MHYLVKQINLQVICLFVLLQHVISYKTCKQTCEQMCHILADCSMAMIVFRR